MSTMINHLSKQANKQIPLIDSDNIASDKIDNDKIAGNKIDSHKIDSHKIDNHQNSNDGFFDDAGVFNNSPRWQSLMADVITDVDELLDILDLTHIKSSLYIPKTFGLRVPRGFVLKMERGNSKDPLLRQVLPYLDENISVNGYVNDPLAEKQHNPIQGLLHKYRSRVLVTVTGACAIHCRYCFRQHFDYQMNLPNTKQLAKIQDYIVQHSDIDEVILSGGDPLSISNRRLNIWLDALEDLPQIKVVRIHTRLPVVIPERLDTELLDRLAASRCQIIMVIHTNHANEIDTKTGQFLLKAKRRGITLLNQAVLLAGINDAVDVQVDLNRRLFEVGVMPYYLHLLDKVAGAAHFDKQKSQAVRLYWQLLEHLPGYLMPKLVQELPNKPFKTPVNLYL